MPTESQGSRTIGDELKRAESRLSRAGVSEARAEAAWLLARLLDTDRGGLLARRAEPLAAGIAATYSEWIERRAGREPAQHITGVQEFYGLQFRVDGRVMIPRPETEDVVEAALGLGLPHGAHAADLGTGSGCIAVALAARRPDLQLHALDRSAAALVVARQNACLHGLERRIELVEADLAAPPRAWIGRMLLVVSNPPYVPLGDWSGLQREVRDHDPREALVAGPSGLEVYQALAPTARQLLSPGGHLVVEVGYRQAGDARAIVERAGFRTVETREDLQGIPRVIVAQRL